MKKLALLLLGLNGCKDDCKVESMVMVKSYAGFKRSEVQLDTMWTLESHSDKSFRAEIDRLNTIIKYEII